MDIRFVASFSVISSDVPADRRLYAGALGLPLHPPEGAGDDPQGYVFSEELAGCKHFGVWPLADAAESCFGSREWPATHPVPQASVEFEVDDVAAAAADLAAQGYALLHDARREPWQQEIARLQAPNGLVVGVCRTPWLHDS